MGHVHAVCQFEMKISITRQLKIPRRRRLHGPSPRCCLGGVGEAVALFERTLADCERVLGADYPSTRPSAAISLPLYEKTG